MIDSIVNLWAVDIGPGHAFRDEADANVSLWGQDNCPTTASHPVL